MLTIFYLFNIAIGCTTLDSGKCNFVRNGTFQSSCELACEEPTAGKMCTDGCKKNVETRSTGKCASPIPNADDCKKWADSIPGYKFYVNHTAIDEVKSKIPGGCYVKTAEHIGAVWFNNHSSVGTACTAERRCVCGERITTSGTDKCGGKCTSGETCTGGKCMCGSVVCGKEEKCTAKKCEVVLVNPSDPITTKKPTHANPNMTTPMPKPTNGGNVTTPMPSPSVQTALSKYWYWIIVAAVGVLLLILVICKCVRGGEGPARSADKMVVPKGKKVIGEHSSTRSKKVNGEHSSRSKKVNGEHSSRSKKVNGEHTSTKSKKANGEHTSTKSKKANGEHSSRSKKVNGDHSSRSKSSKHSISKVPSSVRYQPRKRNVTK